MKVNSQLEIFFMVNGHANIIIALMFSKEISVINLVLSMPCGNNNNFFGQNWSLYLDVLIHSHAESYITCI